MRDQRSATRQDAIAQNVLELLAIVYQLYAKGAYFRLKLSEEGLLPRK
jgi:hypothetical protein